MNDEEMTAATKALRIDELNSFMAKYTHEDDYTLVVNLAAFVEEALERLIRARLREGSATDELLEPTRPLASLSAKISICRALGVISGEQYKDLNILRKIRNEFAHNWRGSNLEHHRGRIMSMTKKPKIFDYGSDLRDRFITCMFTMLGSFLMVHFGLMTRGGRVEDASTS